jgi:hypothetical protein
MRWTLAFLLGVLGVLYLWPVFQRGLQSSSSPRYNAAYAGYGGYRGYGGYGRDSGYGGNGGYGGYGGGTPDRTWGQPTYAVYAPYQPRPRVAPPPCYSPCY